MQSPEIQKLRKEDYKAYRRLYNHHLAYNTPWYCDVCNNGKNYTLRNKHGLILKQRNMSVITLLPIH